MSPSAFKQQHAHFAQVIQLRGNEAAKMPGRWADLVVEAGRAWTAIGSSPLMFPTQLGRYLRDAQERSILTADALRKRGNQFVRDERKGHPPLLKFAYETLMDGRALERPVNYSLLRIVSEAAPEPGRRPYVIIDPRAGHGAGIGGFKPDSQVGVALRHGHPVYFVAFHPHPEPNQTIADITAAEAMFLRQVTERHPDAPKPVVVGNCQGGWAAMLLAASNPELTGVVMVNGAPLSYWAGVAGKNPMRYMGGLFGGALPALVLSDLGSGQFDGANLVLNFETHNPGRSWFRKYYDLYAHIDEEEERFLDFARWWSGYYFMNESEIRWIVENLFIGNRLALGKAGFHDEDTIDLRRIESPVIIFASHGDNITPPQQALNWIADAYHNVDEIKALGRRIAYMIDDQVGHLGIFVSAKVARHQHNEMALTLDALESLPPGLYEMILEERRDTGDPDDYWMRFEPRTIDDLLVHDDGRDDEAYFEAVSELSQRLVRVYEKVGRPIVRASVTEPMSQVMFASHPLRLQRYLASDKVNPLMRGVGAMAEKVRNNRHPVESDNPLLTLEKVWAESVHATIDAWASVRDMWLELTFFGVWGNPLMRAFHQPNGENLAPRVDLVAEDAARLRASMNDGGFVEAVTRMLLLIAAARGSVMFRSRLNKATALMRTAPHFKDLDEAARQRLITEQGRLVNLDADAARAALTTMLPDAQLRRIALELTEEVAGPRSKMTEAGGAELDRQTELLSPREIAS